MMSGINSDSSNVTPDLIPALSSQQPSLISSQDLDNLLSAFFKSEYSQPYLDKIDPSKLSLSCIQQICWRIYFQFLQVNYDLHGVGSGDCSFLPENILQISKQTALNQAVRHCEMLVKITKCPLLQTELQQKHVTDQLRASLNGICSSLDDKNTERRNQYISRNQNGIINRFEQTLKIHYNLLYQENEQSKFYKPITLNKFVNETIKESFETCDAFVKLLTPTDQQNPANCPGSNEDQVSERFEFTKMCIRKYGSDLISKNSSNLKIFRENLNIIFKQFEANCLNVIQQRSFLTNIEIKEVVKGEKNKCFQQITNICHESVVENCPEPTSYYENKLNEKEKLVLKSSIQLARTEDRGALKTYFERIESILGIKDMSDWLRAEAKESRVNDFHIEIVKNTLLEAFQKCKEKCERTIPDVDDDDDIEKQTIGIAHPIAGQSSGITSPSAAIGHPTVTSPNSSTSSPNKHKISSSSSPSNYNCNDPRLNGGGKRSRTSL